MVAWAALAPVLAAAVSSAGSMASGALGSGSSWKNTKRSLYLNYALNQASLRESPSNARLGYEKAGYNPILAIDNGSTPFLSGTNANGGDYSGLSSLGDSLSNAYQTFKLNKQSVNNQTLSTLAGVDNSNAQASLYKEQALTEQAKRINLDFQNAMLDVEKHLKDKELSWSDRRFYSEVYERMQRAENYGAIASIERFNAQTNRQNAETNALNAKTNIGRAIGTGLGSALGLGLGFKYFKNAKYLKNFSLGKGGFNSSLAKYFTTLH